MAAPVDKDYDEEIKKARDELLTSISKEKSSARDLLRVAYASQFSIDKPYNDGAETTAKNHHKTIGRLHFCSLYSNSQYESIVQTIFFLKKVKKTFNLLVLN